MEEDENDGVLELVKNVSCNPNTDGLYLLESRVSYSKLAWKPRTFHWIMECFSQARWVTSPSRHRTGQKTGSKEPDFSSAFFSLSEATGLGGTWGLLEGVERLGCENPSTSTRTLSTLTLVGEHLEDESSFEVAVFK